MTRMIVALAVGLTLGVAGLSVPASATPLPGPPLQEDPAKLAASLSCTPGVETSPKPTVLLVHGTFATPSEDWGPNLAAELPKMGFPTCMVTVPDRQLKDVQRSVEYVVSSIRALYVRSGKKIAIIGHSQGAFLDAYALRFWPDLATKVDDFIGYAGTYTYGSDFATMRCVVACPEAFKQLSPGSRLLKAVSAKPMPAGPSYTAYSTKLDEIVIPQPKAGAFSAPGLRNYVLQDICPLDTAEHLLIPFEKPFLALTLDALNNPGPGQIERTGTLPCGLIPGAVLLAPGLLSFTINGAILAGAQNFTTTEPPLRCYLDPNCTAPHGGS